MSNMKSNVDNKQYGKTVYNASIVQNIVALAVAEVEGVMPFEGKKNSINLSIDRDGVYAKVAVTVKYGYNVPELAYRIQQSVKQSVENMTRYRVAEVDVHVEDVVFCELTPTEKEHEEKETEEQENDAENKN